MPLDEYAGALAAAAHAALPGWVERCVERRLADHGAVVTDDLRAAARAAGVRARDEIGAELRALLAADVDAQRTSPLAVLRRAVRYPTEVLRSAGVPPVARDEFAQRSFPDDVYDLSPATWRSIEESLQEPGIVWGAWKAKTVLDRRRAEGQR
jgi:hypothetical protein